VEAAAWILDLRIICPHRRLLSIRHLLSRASVLVNLHRTATSFTAITTDRMTSLVSAVSQSLLRHLRHCSMTAYTNRPRQNLLLEHFGCRHLHGRRRDPILGTPGCRW